MANIAGRVVMKGLTVAVGIPGGKVVKKAVEGTWATARSADTPRKPKDPGVRWGDAVAWAALSAAGIVIAELLTRKTAEEAWRLVMGNEPPPPKKTRAEKNLEQAQEKVS